MDSIQACLQILEQQTSNLYVSKNSFSNNILWKVTKYLEGGKSSGVILAWHHTLTKLRFSPTTFDTFFEKNIRQCWKIHLKHLKCTTQQETENQRPELQNPSTFMNVTQKHLSKVFYKGLPPHTFEACRQPLPKKGQFKTRNEL